jgi:hypothetical protein
LDTTGERRGTPGLDIFKIAGASISGWYASSKACGHGRDRQPFTTQMEFMLGLYLEYHPWVQHYQRGDMSAAFAHAHQLDAPLGTPYPITYHFEDTPHEYLPDYVGTLVDGGLLVAEAGRAEQKACGQSLAKADAARRLAQARGGVFWLGTEDTLSRARHQNLIFLHARRGGFPTFDEIAPRIRTLWCSGEPSTVADLVARFGCRWSAAEVEAAAWKVAGDAAATGHLVVDLAAAALSLATPISLLPPDESPILPDALPDGVGSPADAAAGQPGERDETGGDELIGERLLPGPTVDASAIASATARATFLRNLAAVTEVKAGRPLTAVARHRGIDPGHLSRLLQRAETRGQPALVPYRSYHRNRTFHPEFQELIKTLYSRPQRPSITAICEDPALRRLAADLADRQGQPVHLWAPPRKCYAVPA